MVQKFTTQIFIFYFVIHNSCLQSYEYYSYYEEVNFSSVWCCIMKNSFCRSISFRNCSSVGKYSLYFVANICSFPFNIEYLAISASVSEQSTMPMVGLSPSVRFNSSYIRTYMSIIPVERSYAPHLMRGCFQIPSDCSLITYTKRSVYVCPH